MDGRVYTWGNNEVTAYYSSGGRKKGAFAGFFLDLGEEYLV
jgi:hypothetical protein